MRLARVVAPLVLVSALGAPAAATAAPNEGADTTRTVQGLLDFNDCNGQPVEGSGMATIVTHSVKGGTSFLLSGQFEATDAAGNEYVAHVVQRFTTSSDGDFLFSFHDVLVSKGSVPNENFLLLFGSRNGEFFMRITDDCRG